MNIPAKGLICALSIAMLLVLSAGALDAQISQLPEGLSITDEFSPGLGAAIGSVELVQAKVVIMHSDQARGYWAKQGMPLFKNDVIVTLEGGRVRLQLADQSVLVVGSQSRMVLAESIYDLKKQSRFVFLKLGIGKVRCLVIKLANFRRSNFLVSTPTALAGVRGSDFVVEGNVNRNCRISKGNQPKDWCWRTVITAFEETRVEVVSLAGLDFPPVLVEDFQEIIVDENQLPTDPLAVPLERIEELKQEFSVTPETADGEPPAPMAPVEKAQVSVSDNVLVEPVSVESLVAEEGGALEILTQIQQEEQLDFFEQQQVTIIEDVNELVNQELPGFPRIP